MSVFRAPPPVLPSLRPLVAQWHGSRDDEWNDDVEETVFRLRAASAPPPPLPGAWPSELPPTSRVFALVPPPPKSLPRFAPANVPE